jgi:hypothetical protein
MAVFLMTVSNIIAQSLPLFEAGGVGFAAFGHFTPLKRISTILECASAADAGAISALFKSAPAPDPSAERASRFNPRPAGWPGDARVAFYLGPHRLYVSIRARPGGRAMR